MILYHDDQLIEHYKKYQATMPTGMSTLDIEQYRVRIFEPLLEEEYHGESRE